MTLREQYDRLDALESVRAHQAQAYGLAFATFNRTCDEIKELRREIAEAEQEMIRQARGV